MFVRLTLNMDPQLFCELLFHLWFDRILCMDKDLNGFKDMDKDFNGFKDIWIKIYYG